MYSKVREFIKDNNLIHNSSSVVLGISGGADSISMLDIFCRLSGEMDLKLTCVHVNHGIREEASEDEAFVEDECKKRGIPFTVFHEDVTAKAKLMKTTVEEAGRLARYEAFEEVRSKLEGEAVIAVAHNKDDLAETVILNLVRGTGLKGLSGIPVKRGSIVRPLLCVSRDEIEGYIKERNLSYVTDKTNLSNDYTRNKIRNVVLKYLKEEVNEASCDNIVRAAKIASEAAQFMELEADKAYGEYVKGNTFLQDGFLLHSAVKSLVYRRLIGEVTGSLKDISEAHVESVIGLEDNQVSAIVSLPGGVIARRTYDGVLVKKESEVKDGTEGINNGFFKEPVIILNKAEKDDTIAFDSIAEEVIFDRPPFRVTLIKAEDVRGQLSDLEYTKYVDYDRINRLELRTKLPGDYMVIGKESSRKKLSRIFIDSKVDLAKRDEIPLFADGSEIIWAVGVRFSEKYYIDNDTKFVLKLELLT